MRHQTWLVDVAHEKTIEETLKAQFHYQTQKNALTWHASYNAVDHQYEELLNVWIVDWADANA